MGDGIEKDILLMPNIASWFSEYIYINPTIGWWNSSLIKNYTKLLSNIYYTKVPLSATFFF